ncbi:MAG: ATP-dependent zinc protease [Granulosicoccus sp.]
MTSQQSDVNKPEGSPIHLSVGWREWVSLPELGLPAIKAKVDTGARTSAIHASDIERFKHDDGSDWVNFTVMPIQRLTTISRRCAAPLVDIRKVTDSGGHTEERFFISTKLVIGELTRTVEITLAQRSDMLFRMLLGRTSMVPDIVVNPHLSYTLGRMKARAIYKKSASGADT